jgi:HTH-type transcriptional regulator/antitoxin HigA
MKSKTLHPYKPNYCSHPGETLLETINQYGLTISEFSKLVDVPPLKITNIVNWQAPITLTIAEKLENTLHISSDFWMAMQENYDRFQRNRLTKTMQSDSI